MRLKVALIIFVAIFSTLLLVTIYYPISLSAQTITLGDDFEAKMEAAEKAVGPFQDTEKKIIWFKGIKEKTDTAIIYLHGWSATRQEISPTIETVALDTGSNVFFTRLHGHGLGPKGMLKAKLKDLLEDAEEAMAIGRRLGKKIIVVGMSTGAPLAIYLANKYPEEISNMILISANFRPYRWEAFLLRGPWGPWLTDLILGHEFHFDPKNTDQAKYWTFRYPPRALNEMMKLVDGGHAIDLGNIKIPTLFLYTNKDSVVSVDLIKESFDRVGAIKKKLIEVPSQGHILSGSIMSPDTTPFVIQQIKDFIR